MLKKRILCKPPWRPVYSEEPHKHYLAQNKINGSIKYIFNDLNPKTSNLIILKEAIIKKKRIFRRTNSACIHYSFILLNIFLTTSL